MEGLEVKRMGKCDDIMQQFMEIDGREGLAEEIFIAVSTIIPIVNVDLMILDRQNRILLSWRDDEYFGKGWHLPGVCIRYKETMAERIQKTALNEIGTTVIADLEPIAVRDVIMGRDDERVRKRAHHLAILHRCYLPDDFVLKSKDGQNETSELKWFSAIPNDILPVHFVYDDVFRQYGLIK